MELNFQIKLEKQVKNFINESSKNLNNAYRHYQNVRDDKEMNNIKISQEVKDKFEEEIGFITYNVEDYVKWIANHEQDGYHIEFIEDNKDNVSAIALLDFELTLKCDMHIRKLVDMHADDIDYKKMIINKD